MYPTSQHPSAKKGGFLGNAAAPPGAPGGMNFNAQDSPYWNPSSGYPGSYAPTLNPVTPSLSGIPQGYQGATGTLHGGPPSYPHYPNTNGLVGQPPYGKGTVPLAEGGHYPPSMTPGVGYESIHGSLSNPGDLCRNALSDPLGKTGASTLNIGELNASATFIQSTHGRLPQSPSLKQKSHIPIGLLIRPLAPSDQVIPDVNFGSSGKVIRCFRCRTYINNFVTWDSTGRRWTCNICDMANECPPHYASPLDDLGGKANATQYPELHYGSVEIIATSDYMVRPPQPPTYMFLIDVSASSVASGLLTFVCQGIKSFLDHASTVERGSRTQIGFITFDSSVHFYKLDPQTPHPELIVVPTLTDIFLPISDHLLVNLKDSDKQIRTLLDILPTMWSSQKVTESCLGTALMAAHTVLKPWGGKLSVFITTLPTLGENHLCRYREVATRSSTTKSSTDTDAALLKPLSDDYVALSQLMAQAQICVDLYACPPALSNSFSNLGLPTLCPLTRFTAGELRYYPGFTAHSAGPKLEKELLHVLTRKTGWEAVMRIRVSQGWKIVDWTGHFHFRNNDLLVLPNCHEDQVFGITLEHHETLAQDQFFYLQSALLYTSNDGERRIRVHTYCIPTTQSLPELASSIDEDTLVSILVRQSIIQAIKTNMGDVRGSLQTQFFQIYSVLQQGSFNSLPLEGRKQFLLPHYILGFLKCAALRDSRDVHPDLRIYHWLRLLSLPRDQLVLFLYPHLYALHDLENHSYGQYDDRQAVCLPPLLGLSSRHMSQDGAYLLCDGESMLLWLGKVLNPQWLYDVLGVNETESLEQANLEALLGATGSNLASRVINIIQGLRASCLPFVKLTVILQGSPNEYKFFYALIEDKNHACMLSYDDFCKKLSLRQQTTPTAASVTPAAGYPGYTPRAPAPRVPPMNPTTHYPPDHGIPRPGYPHPSDYPDLPQQPSSLPPSRMPYMGDQSAPQGTTRTRAPFPPPQTPSALH